MEPEEREPRELNHPPSPGQKPERPGDPQQQGQRYGRAERAVTPEEETFTQQAEQVSSDVLERGSQDARWRMRGIDDLTGGLPGEEATPGNAAKAGASDVPDSRR
jgi:hypothetical protein